MKINFRKFPKSDIDILKEQLESITDTVERLPEEIEATLILPLSTPINAKAASCVLTVSDTPEEGDTVTIDTKTYKARLDVLGAGAYALIQLALNSNPLEGDTFTVGDETYKVRRDALGSGVAASAVLTSDETAPTDGDTVTIGTRVYRLKDSPSQANDIAISTAAVTMTRIFKAINGTGIAGSDYFAGTAVPDVAVTAVNTSEFVVTVTANSVGFAGNLFAKAENSTHLDWDGAGATFTGGIDAQAANDIYVDGLGTSSTLDNFVIAINAGYSEGITGTGTAVNSAVIALKLNSTTIRFTAKTVGFIGNSIVATSVFDDVLTAWSNASGYLINGVDPQAANDVFCTTAETFINNLVKAVADSGTEGTHYGTGTTIHTTCTASKTTAATMTCSSILLGVSGNDIPIDANGRFLSWAEDATELSEGVDGTPGTEGQSYFSTTKLWVCNATDLTIENDNWLSTTLT